MKCADAFLYYGKSHNFVFKFKGVVGAFSEIRITRIIPPIKAFTY